MGKEGQLALPLSDGMLVKRPVLVADGLVPVGSQALERAAALGAKTDDQNTKRELSP